MPNAVPNYVRLEGHTGFGGTPDRSYSYSQANSRLSVIAHDNHLSLVLEGDERWFGEFETPGGVGQLKTGTYPGLRGPFPDAKAGELDWLSGAFSSVCTATQGSLTIDSLTYAAGALSSIDLRFQQYCDTEAAPMLGTIHWRADDTTAPPGPVTPIPAGLWQPAAGSTPAAGNYVYLQGDAGDQVLNGRTLVESQNFAITSVGPRVKVTSGFEGSFNGMYSLSQLQPGYYGGLHRPLLANPAIGSLSWVSPGSLCATLSGWFVVDRVVYSGGVMTALDLRFEQHCRDAVPALHGAIHWVAPA